MTTETELLPERKEPEGFRLRVLNRNDLKLEDYYYLEDLLKRRTPSPAQPEWLPLESAPRDGTHIMFGRELPWSSSENVCVGFWADESISDNPHFQTSSGFLVDTRIYRYWQPLPQPPKEQQ